MNQKENKTGKNKNSANTSQSNRHSKIINKSRNKKQTKSSKPQAKLLNNHNRTDLDTNNQSMQITNLKKLIETKNKEIKCLDEENKKNKNFLIEKEKEVKDKDNTIDMLYNEINLLKNNNESLNKEIKDKLEEIKELNYSLAEYKQKVISNEESINFMNQIKECDNIDKRIENYEIELNKIKNNLNESEIKNTKLIFDNNILQNKIETINKEKEIK